MKNEWKTWLMGAASAEKAELMGRTAHLSHAVVDYKPLCRKVNIGSLVDDESTWTNELPDCPECQKKIERMK